MSSLVARKLQDAAIEEIRPLLQLNHVTPARAKEMLRMGLKTIRDVALVDPPLLLSLGVTNMPKWTAVEIVSDARLHIMQDALELAAESEDCRDAISRRPVTTSAMS
ncbi:uncharacterized protein LOC127751550 [Frankliniella occidentalis]|uniref:Uncharacterized protein LOC127751550 n=1 Tax=Frankliniella occidentalis TaxID=133901 RepID=A0A9C6XTY2_FRAOC|nr:uncharacterized protein LOC127751550 [Frankliniella occidentalis]